MKHLNQYITEFVVKKHIQSSYETVDLDLPSGLLWATCNIGAEKPEDYGLLFQWGRIDGYKYRDNNHKFLSEESYTTTSEKQYKVSDILDKKDDAAYQATNGELRMPTVDELRELKNYTDNEWTELNGVRGRKFISKKDDSKWIFIPAAGCNEGGDNKFFDAVAVGYVWSSTVSDNYSDSICYLLFDATSCTLSTSGDCWFAQSVRGVFK